MRFGGGCEGLHLTSLRGGCTVRRSGGRAEPEWGTGYEAAGGMWLQRGREGGAPVTEVGGRGQVVEKFFGELATLGFIGTIAFVLTTGFAGHESVRAREA